jgi:ribosomal protein S18 acetylase RimI-like enzyme
MRRQLTGAGFGGDATYIHIIESRDQARDCQCFFDQLRSLYYQLTEEHLAEKNFVELVSSGSNIFILITQGTNLLATATFVFVRTPTKRRGFIEDVVVNNQYRNRGLGRILVEEAVALGRVRSCHYVQLTSKPSRPGTAVFYPKLGFEIVAQAHGNNGTNLYRRHFRSSRKT